MTDVPKEFTAEFGRNVNKSLSRVMELTGKADTHTLQSIINQLSFIKNHIREIDRLAKDLPLPGPLSDDVEDWVSRHPYANKEYKRQFLTLLRRLTPRSNSRFLTKVIPVLRRKHDIAAVEYRAGKQTLSVLRTLLTVIQSNMNLVLERSKALDMAVPADDEEEALRSTTESLEKEMSDEGISVPKPTDKYQQQNQLALKRKTKRKVGLPTTTSSEDFEAAIAKYSSRLNTITSVVKNSSDELEELLRNVPDNVFSLVTRVARTFTALATVLSRGIGQARKDGEPGTYLAFRGFVNLVVELNRTIVKSAGMNKEQKRKINRYLKEQESAAESE